MKLPILFTRLGIPVIHTTLPGFDPVYYQYWYRDVLRFRAGPVAHYLLCGWKEGRDPSAGFSTSGYLKANPDVSARTICPLVHFLEHGLAEGRTGWQKDPSKPPPVPGAADAPLKLLPPPNPARNTA